MRYKPFIEEGHMPDFNLRTASICTECGVVVAGDIGGIANHEVFHTRLDDIEAKARNPIPIIG